MTPDKVLEVCRMYRNKLSEYVDGPEAYPHDTFMRSDVEGLRHAWRCIDQIEGFLAAGRVEKAHRWLGFVQGVLWSCRVYEINSLKGHNRPDDQGTETQTFEDPAQEMHGHGCGKATDADLAPIETTTDQNKVFRTFAPREHYSCLKPPMGWRCSRPADHEGPCAASPVNDNGDTNPIPLPNDREHRPSPPAGSQPVLHKSVPGSVRLPIGSPVKILRGGPYGSDGKLGVVDGHVGEGYGVQLEGTTQVIYAEEVEYHRPARQ